jgi:shikimate kinase
MRVYLVGYMGSGKSTVGRRLAHLTGWLFIDLDKYIEERYCRSVPQIFAIEGEAAFRVKEQKALEEVSEFDNVIVATGGGAPCFFDNMSLMNRTGTTLFLDVAPQVLAGRLAVSKTERPLIKGKTRQELIDFIIRNLEIRRPFYELAHHRITGTEMNAEAILQMISESPGHL